jgi:ActR/RegA family two-component response regulator
MIAASVFSHAASPAGASASQPPPAPIPAGSSPVSLAEVERAHIERVLNQLEGNVTRAATALGIDRRTLQRKLRSFGIAAPED